MGRSKKYLTEAERIKGYRRDRQKCLREKEWCCETCGGDKNYTLAGIWMHLRTKKHQENLRRINAPLQPYLL